MWDKFIEEAQKLEKEDWRTPLLKKFGIRVGKYISDNFGEEEGKIIESTLRLGVVYGGNDYLNQQNHIKRMHRVIQLLESYKADEVVSTEQPIIRPGTLDSLHLAIKEKCSSLYNSGNYAEAVEKGFKIVKDRLRELTRYESGSDAFGKGKLHVRGASAPNVDEDFQQAVKLLTMSIDRFRNEKVHTSDSRIEDPVRAFEYLSLSSLALNLLSQAEIK